jgi:O-antigen ligase
MGLLMVLSDLKIKRVVKIASIGVILLDVFLSSSMTSSFLLIVVLGCFLLERLYYILTKGNEKLGRILKVVLGIVIAVVIVIGVIYFYNKLSVTRDIKTLGTRTMIWSSAVDYIKKNPGGLIKIPVTFRLQGFFENAHNLVLNEMIETGIVGGYLYLAIFLMLGICLRKNLLDFIAFMCIFIASQFDMVFYGEVLYVFWGVFALILSSHM